jgi:predicted N-acyltransferase
LAEKGYEYNKNAFLSRFYIDLNTDLKHTLLSIKKRRRHNIKTTFKKNFKVNDEEINQVNMNRFYESYTLAMKKVNGIVLPHSFFLSIMKNIPDRIKIFTASVEGKAVGRCLFLQDTEQSTFRALFAGIEPSNFKYFPYEMIHWYAIKWALKHKFNIYDLGRNKSDFRNGGFRFKEQFNAQVAPSLSWVKRYSLARSQLLLRIGKYFHRKLG